MKQGYVSTREGSNNYVYDLFLHCRQAVFFQLQRYGSNYFRKCYLYEQYARSLIDIDNEQINYAI